MSEDYPSYSALLSSGELGRRADEAFRHLEECDLCAHHCGVDRTAGELGKCGLGTRSRVSSVGPHFGEEPPLVGRRGSGTIFFSHCNLACIFCQNWEISHACEGHHVDSAELARLMLHLAEIGCHNVNLVTPSPHIPMILQALIRAADDGLRLPLVHNCGGYESPQALALLDGVVDIYMPDIKYGVDEVGGRLSGTPSYFSRAKEALKEMHRQVGDLILDNDGIARRGLLVRHLVLPHGLAGTRAVARFLADEISRNTYLNLMDQYRPCYQAGREAELERPLSAEEYREALGEVEAAGLSRLAR